MPESPQFLLPFAEREYVDVARASRILGASWQTVIRLAQGGLLEMVDYRQRAWKKIRYRSIANFCDQLRAQYSIPDRRPTLSAAFLRHRDEDLLPFPLSITMGSEEAIVAMGMVNKDILPKLIEEGRFEAYRLTIGSPWRISRPSFTEYLESSRHEVKNESFPLRRRNISDDCIL
jgi:hypothetical protein